MTANWDRLVGETDRARAAEARVAELEAELKKVKEQWELAAKIQVERSEVAEAEVEKLRAEKRHVEAAFDQLDGIKGRAEKAEAEVERLREVARKAWAISDEHKAKLAEVEEELSHARMATHDAEKLKDSFQAEVEKLRQARDKYRERAVKTDAELAELEAEVENLEEDLTTARRQADYNIERAEKAEAKLAGGVGVGAVRNMTATFDIRPIPGEEYEGRQHGWRIYKDDFPFLDCSTGGTGPCWNVRESDDEGADRLHICDLDEMAQALVALRDSEAHRLNEERWS